MSETKRTELIGKVVSAANNKTITVLVETYRNHPLYKKRMGVIQFHSVLRECQ